MVTNFETALKQHFGRRERYSAYGIYSIDFSFRFRLVEVVLLYLIIVSVCKDILYTQASVQPVSPFSYIGNNWRQKVTDDWTEAWILQ